MVNKRIMRIKKPLMAINLSTLLAATITILVRHHVLTVRHLAEALALAILWSSLSRLAEIMLWEAAGVWMVIDTTPRRRHWANVASLGAYLADHDLSLADRARDIGISPRQLRSALRHEPPAHRRPSTAEIRAGLADATILLAELVSRYEH